MNWKRKSKSDWGRLDLSYKQLGDFSNIKGGKRLPKGQMLVATPTNHPYIRVRDLGKSKTLELDSSFEYIEQETFEKIARYIVNENDIIISIVGTIGLIGKVGSTLDGANLTENCAKIVDVEGFDKDFLYYYLTSNEGQSAIHAYTVGAVQQKLPLKNIIELMIPDIPLENQKKIAKTLSAFDDRIAENKKINHHLEQIAFAIFDDMFPNVSLGSKLVGEYIVPKRGKGLLSKDAIAGKVPVVAGGLQPATYHNTANTVAPVITISASGANAGYVNLWSVPVWSSDSSFIDSSMSQDVYFWYVMLKKRQQEIYESQTGSAQPHIYPKHIEILPTIELSQESISVFTTRVTPIFTQIGKNFDEIQVLQNTRDVLLPKLISGDISVTD